MCSQFGWHVYKRVGANNVLINMFTRFQIFKSLLKVHLILPIVSSSYIATASAPP